MLGPLTLTEKPTPVGILDFIKHHLAARPVGATSEHW